MNSRARWMVLVCAAGFLVGYTAWYSGKFHGHLSGLVGLSRNFLDPARTTPETFVWGGGEHSTGFEGYDGQFFYYLAHDPFHRHVRLESFDNLPYRSQRMMYPLLVYLASGGGQTRWVPLAMVIVNGLAILGVVWCVLWLLSRDGRSVWWSVVVFFSVGLLWPYVRCLSDPLALCGLMMAVVFVKKERWGWVAVMLMFSCLTRERGIGYVPIFGWIVARRSIKAGAVVSLVPLGVWGAWQCYMQSLYGVFPVLAITQYPLLSWPFHGWVDRLVALITKGHGHCEGPEAVFMFWFLAASVWWVKHFFQRGTVVTLSRGGTAKILPPVLMGTWLTIATLVLGWFVNIHIWEDFCCSARTLSFLPFAMLLSEVEEPHPMKRRFLWISLVIGLAWLVCDIR